MNYQLRDSPLSILLTPDARPVRRQAPRSCGEPQLRLIKSATEYALKEPEEAHKEENTHSGKEAGSDRT